MRETAFECLVKIAANYYEKLPAYMQDIFTLTHRAAKEDEEDVGKQAVEFWCTICEEELDLQEARPRTCCLPPVHRATHTYDKLSLEGSDTNRGAPIAALLVSGAETCC